MTKRHLDHIDLRVRDFERARRFYERLLPALGFTCDRSDTEWGTFYAAGRDRPSEFFGFTEDRHHQPNEKLIALFKIAKGVLLLLLGASLLFLNARDRWMGALSDWTDEEILLGHSKAVHFLLSKLQDVLAGGGALRATGFLALFYCAVLFTEG